MDWNEFARWMHSRKVSYEMTPPTLDWQGKRVWLRLKWTDGTRSMCLSRLVVLETETVEVTLAAMVVRVDQLHGLEPSGCGHSRG